MRLLNSNTRWFALGRSVAPGRLAVFFLVLAGTAPAAQEISESDFKGAGLCRFATNGCFLAPQTEMAINDSVQKLLERHRSVFGFQTRHDFHLRMRVFGRFEDYTNATFRLYWTNAVDRDALQGRPFNVAGFYTSRTKEIVTWRQEIPGFLGITLLHEASHAIMDAHYVQVPVWLMEGAGDYFAYALHPPDELNQQRLRRRWMRLNLWLRESRLLPLEPLLNADGETFKSLDPEKAYSMSWSLFQLLVSSDGNRRMMLALLGERQEPALEEPDCARQIARLNPGGLQRFEAAWHAWILAGTPATNSPASKPVIPGGEGR